MASILFYVPADAVTETWHTVFDNTKWQDGGVGATNVYSEPQWVQTWHDDGEGGPVDNQSRLDVTGSWYTNFRTTHQASGGEFRLTMAAGVVDPATANSGNPLVVELQIGSNTLTAAYQGSYVWSVTDINLDPADISYIRFSSSLGVSPGACYITNIEFYYDTNNATPGGNWGAGGG